MDKERDIVAADITDIVLTSAEYYWWAGHNDFEFTCKIRGEDDVISMHMYRHDEGYGVTVHSEKDDIWDRMWPNEIRKLDDKLQEAIQYGEYHKRIENLKTPDECDEMEFEFMENDDYYFRLSLSKLWKELNDKRNELEHPTKESVKEKLEKKKSEVKAETKKVENSRENKEKAVR